MERSSLREGRGFWFALMLGVVGLVGCGGAGDVTSGSGGGSAAGQGGGRTPGALTDAKSGGPDGGARADGVGDGSAFDGGRRVAETREEAVGSAGADAAAHPGADGAASGDALDGVASDEAGPRGDADGGGKIGPKDGGAPVGCEQPGALGCPCASAADCASGLCVPSLGGSVCAAPCGSCPAGFVCAEVPGTGGGFACVDPAVTLCEPCSADEQCPGGLCVEYGPDLGSFCGVWCGGDDDCPEGYGCEEVRPGSHQCVAAAGDCACSTYAAQAGAWTPCERQGADGTCTGQRVCLEAGPLPPCDAAEPVPETCNGVDDDCDGATDEGSQACAGGMVCVCVAGACGCECPKGLEDCDGQCVDLQTDAEHCGACEHSCALPHVAASKCVAGACLVQACEASWADLDGIADNGCECAVSVEQCNGADDDCNGLVDDGLCDDGLVCTQDGCGADGQCNHEPASGWCWIDGQCVAAGAVNPANSCLACDPDVDPLHWTPRPATVACDDGDGCTQGDHCDQGQCVGKPLDCSSKEGPCTDAMCSGGVCLAIPHGGPCDDGDACTVGDTCQGGVCAGKYIDCNYLTDDCNTGMCVGGQCTTVPHEGDCDDGDACTVADHCTEGVCGGTPMDCSAKDGPCTVGVCEGGQCVAQNVDGSCDDGDPCTVDDQCFGGTCFGAPKDCSFYNSTCQVGVCDGGLCVPKILNGPCNDFDPCTEDDTCSAGACVGQFIDCTALDDLPCIVGECKGGSCVPSPTDAPCDDGDPCTLDDQCLDGSCQGTLMDCSAEDTECKKGLCVAGQCFGFPKPDGTACDDGDPCTPVDQCNKKGVCVGIPPLDDAPDSVDTLTGWTHLDDVTDCGGLDYSASYKLYPAGDEDWFWYQDTHKLGCTVRPKVLLEVPAGADYDLCVYFQCLNTNDAQGKCIDGVPVQGLPDGSIGCCSVGTGTPTEEVRMEPSCSAGPWPGDDSGYVYIQVKWKKGADICTPYTIHWGDS